MPPRGMDMVWYGMVLYGMVWHGMAWYGLAMIPSCLLCTGVGVGVGVGVTGGFHRQS